jgi:hypothetical protein
MACLSVSVSVSVSVQIEPKFRYFGFGLNSGFGRSLVIIDPYKGFPLYFLTSYGKNSNLERQVQLQLHQGLGLHEGDLNRLMGSLWPSYF